MRGLTLGEQMVVNCYYETGFDMIDYYTTNLSELAQDLSLSSGTIDTLKDIFLKIVNVNRPYEMNIIAFNDEMDKALAENKISQADYNAFYLDTKKRVCNAYIEYYEQKEQEAKGKKEYWQDKLEELTGGN